jgi:hypothetical protein
MWPCLYVLSPSPPVHNWPLVCYSACLPSVVALPVCLSACHAHIFLPSTQGRTRANMFACCCLHFYILGNQWVNSISEHYSIITAESDLPSLLFIHIRYKYQPCTYRIYHNNFEINSYVSISCKSEEKKPWFNFVCLSYWHTLSLWLAVYSWFAFVSFTFIIPLVIMCSCLHVLSPPPPGHDWPLLCYVALSACLPV